MTEQHFLLTVSAYAVNSVTGAQTPERTLYEGDGGAPEMTPRWPPCGCRQAPDCQAREHALNRGAVT